MKRIAVIGGGAAGFFAAIAAAESGAGATVVLFEQSRRPLAKVAISGGGRCNATHACFEPAELSRFYPRGAKELRAAFHQWQPRDTIAWFQSRGVELKTESDGRMFPTTDDSSTIVDCLLAAAREAGVEIRLGLGVTNISRQEATPGFLCSLSDGSVATFDRIILATGGGQKSSGHGLAATLGHTIAPLAPSLFSFHIDHPLLSGLAGLSIEDAQATFAPAKLSQTGPILVTHTGLSGPAILKLSAWGARVFKDLDYQFEITVNWLGGAKPTQARQLLETARSQFAKRQLSSANPFSFSKRFWERLVELSGLSLTGQWAQLPNKGIEALVEGIVNCKLPVTGKSMNKEEFVTCGGIALTEVDFRTMESKLAPGLHFAGEALDLDGVTGGFNFQAAWTTGYLAGRAAAREAG